MNQNTIEEKVKNYRAKIRKNELKHWKKLSFTVGALWLLNFMIGVFYNQTHSLVYENEKLEMSLVFALVFGGVIISYTARVAENIINFIVLELSTECSLNDQVDDKISD